MHAHKNIMICTVVILQGCVMVLVDLLKRQIAYILAKFINFLRNFIWGKQKIKEIFINCR